MTISHATAQQVRKSYADRGFLVRISHDGHVEYREAEDLPWMEGRWVCEYRVIEDQVVLT